MGSIRSHTRQQPTIHVYRVAVPYAYRGDPSAWHESRQLPDAGVHHTDIYASEGQARAAATRFEGSLRRYTDAFDEPLHTFGEHQVQRAELVWSVEQPAVWEPVA